MRTPNVALMAVGIQKLPRQRVAAGGIVASVEICHLYISPGHNFVGHHGREPDTHPAIEVPMIECVAGRGIRGDRYFDFKDDYKDKSHFFRSKFLTNSAADSSYTIARLR